LNQLKKLPKILAIIVIEFAVCFLITLVWVIPLKPVVELMDALGKLAGTYAFSIVVLTLVLIFRRELKDLILRIEQGEGLGFKGKFFAPFLKK